MAGMFYSAEEVCKKLNIADERLKELIGQGKLREFLLGAKALYKVDEVEALMADMGIIAFDDDAAAPEAEVGDAEAPLDLDLAEDVDSEGDVGAATSELLDAITEGPEDQGASGEPDVEAMDEAAELPDMAGELESVDTGLGDVESELADVESELADVESELADVESELAGASSELVGLDDVEGGLGDTVSELSHALDEPAGGTEDSIGVLGESGGEFQLPDDTVAEGGTAAAAAEESLEEIEESVNLDSFGSGSGLLDLSLQADDTSLGGILDEIYSPEGEEGPPGGLDETGSVAEVAAEAEGILAGEDFPAPAPMPMAGPGIVRAFAEPEPDTMSNALGMMLFLPLAVVIYTAIIAAGGFRGVVPVIAAAVAKIIWPVVGGLGAVVLAIVGVAFMMSHQGPKTARPAKPKKIKAKKVKPKKEKVKKEKKPKKPKKG